MADFQDVSYSVPVEGEIAQPQVPEEEDDDELSTLDEPVKDTFIRDMKVIGSKFAHIIYPRSNSLLLRDWDLWGPLVLCVILAVFLNGAKDETTGGQGPQFAEVFVVVWVGAGIVTLNAQLLGGKISFFQSVCVLGYCILPLVVAMIICWFLVKIFEQSIVFVVIRIILVAAAYGWSIFGPCLITHLQCMIPITVVTASVAFLGDSQPKGRKALAVFPICLFYFILAWMVVTYS
uniref:Protein YIPF n=1 Tax=Phallusia mammillata TaxID=59560 RepID=A0A6F9DXR2_9ASCI|nr:protein YIPF6-like [Phallusia mammillata]